MSTVKVDATKLRALIAKGLKPASVKVGVMQSSGSHKESGISLAELAAVHEFGSPSKNIPERSFIRAPLDNSAEITELIRKLGKGILIGRFSTHQALEILGAKAVSHVRNYSRQGDSPHTPNKPATVKAKGSSRPLVDTGQLLNAITYKVIFS